MIKKRYRKTRLTEADKKEICDYYAKGFSTIMISKTLGWGESTVDRVRRESGVPSHRDEQLIRYQNQITTKTNVVEALEEKGEMKMKTKSENRKRRTRAFCQRFNELICERFSSKVEAIAYLKINDSSFYDYMNGISLPRYDRLLYLAKMLDVSPMYLSGETAFRNIKDEKKDEEKDETEYMPSLSKDIEQIAEKAKEEYAAAKESEEEACKRAKNLNGEGSFYWVEDRRRWVYRKTVSGFGRLAFYGRTKEECLEKANDFCRSKSVAKLDKEGTSFLDMAIAHAKYVVECLENHRDCEMNKTDASSELVESIWEAFDKYTTKTTTNKEKENGKL